MRSAPILRTKEQHQPILSVVKKPTESYILMTPLTCKIIMKLYAQFGCDTKVKEWLDKPNRNFTNISPRVMINHDRGSRVLELLTWSATRNGPID